MNVLNKEKMTLIEENLLLKKEVEKFSNIATKLTKGKENLEKLLGSQRQSLSKHGLGYIPFTTKKYSKIVFVKEGYMNDDSCSYCNMHGHYAKSCKLKHLRYVGIKKIWVPKGTILPNLVRTNPKRFGYQFQKFDMSL